MFELDLSVHQGAAVVGKAVTLHGRRYRVAASEQADGFPYVLVNERTGLALQAARFVPEGEEGSGAEPDTWVLPVLGGSAVLAAHDGPVEPEAPWTEALATSIEALASRDLARAESCARQVLALHPAHALAMHRLSFALAAQQRAGEALTLSAEACELEPAFPQFAVQDLRLCASFSLAVGRESFLSHHKRFPRHPELLGVGAQILVELGQPAEARALLDVLGDRCPPQLLAVVAAEVLAWESAAEALSAAEASSRTDPVATLGHLRRAASLHPKNPLTLANLGFTLLRAGRPQEAVRPLLAAADRVTARLLKLCMANAAFALVDAGRPRDAVGVLVGAASDAVAGELDAGALLADLPLVCAFVRADGISLEELPSATLPRVERIVEAAGAGAPPELLRIAEAYRLAVSAEATGT